MDSTNTSAKFSIGNLFRSRKNTKKIIIFSLLLLILVVIIFFNTVSPLIFKKPKMELFLPHRLSTVESTPGLVISNPILVAINELNTTAASITKVLSSTTNASLVLLECLTRMQNSMIWLNRSLDTVGVGSDIASLTHRELTEIRIPTRHAMLDCLRCSRALEGEEQSGVEEVKLGLANATEYMTNVIGLLDEREAIMDDYYSLVYIDTDYYSYHYMFHNIYLVCLFYIVVYCFIAVLYLLFWRM